MSESKFESIYSTWGGWKHLSPETKKLFKEIIDGNANQFYAVVMKYPSERFKIHTIANKLGLSSLTDKSGKNQTKPIISLSKKTDFEYPPLIFSESEMHKFQPISNNRKERKDERFEMYIQNKECDCCGCSNSECELGYARDGSVLCSDCVDNEPELSCLKWESIRSCF